jgi:hypothetical protein
MRLVPSAVDALQAMTLQASSVSRAEVFLKDRGMFEPGTNGERFLLDRRGRG